MMPRFTVVDGKDPTITMPINTEFTLGKFYNKFGENVFYIRYEDDCFEFRKYDTGMYFDTNAVSSVNIKYIQRIVEYLNALYDSLHRFCLNKSACDDAINEVINFAFTEVGCSDS